MTDYYQAPEVAEVAAPIIEEHHPHLLGVRVDYLFRSPPAIRNDKLVLGKARRVSGLTAFLAGHPSPFFVIEIAGDPWQDLPEEKRRALVDHELSHCVLDEDEVPRLHGHDVEEFVAIVERHGLWTSDVQAFGLAVQTTLPFGADE